MHLMVTGQVLVLVTTIMVPGLILYRIVIKNSMVMALKTDT